MYLKKFCTHCVEYIYTSIVYITLPYVILRLLLKSKKNPGYRKNIFERFGRPHFSKLNKPSIWIHAVSLGETLAAKPLIAAIQKKYPDTPIVITNITPTGREATKKLAQNNPLIHYTYLPYDTPKFIQAFIRKADPKLLLIMETEIWPNLLKICKKSHIPTLLANARLSKKSYQSYSKFGFLTLSMIQKIFHICTQFESDTLHFKQLGYSDSKITQTGSVKFDLQLPENLKQSTESLYSLIQKHHSTLSHIWIAASTHSGEDEIILKAHQNILKTYPNTLLILVPRHPERFESVYTLSQNSFDFNTLNKTDLSQTQSKSKSNSKSNLINVLIGNTLGELLIYYALADIAFVGGSLVPIGGHNILEPAALSKAIITGPYMHNFQAISDRFIHSKACEIISNSQELSKAIIDLLDKPNKLKTLSQNAKQCFTGYQGATEKHLNIIQNILN